MVEGVWGRCCAPLPNRRPRASIPPPSRASCRRGIRRPSDCPGSAGPCRGRDGLGADRGEGRQVQQSRGGDGRRAALRLLGEASKAQVIYRSDAVHPRHQANFRIFDPLDFLAKVSAHIPDSHEKTTLFSGWYSNRTRGDRQRHGPRTKAEAADPTADDEGTRAPLEVRRSWAWLIRQVYEIDPLP